MGLRLKIEGSESIDLKETSITNVKFGADIPHDSNARSTDLGSTILIEGKILAPVDGEAADDTSKDCKVGAGSGRKFRLLQECGDQSRERITDCTPD